MEHNPDRAQITPFDDPQARDSSDLVARLATDDDLHTVWFGAGPLGLEIEAAGGAIRVQTTAGEAADVTADGSSSSRRLSRELAPASSLPPFSFSFPSSTNSSALTKHSFAISAHLFALSNGNNSVASRVLSPFLLVATSHANW